MDPGDYVNLATRLPAYMGVLAARAQAERDDEESKPVYAPESVVFGMLEGQW